MKYFEGKSTIEEIRKRFDYDVERFSDLETGQRATIDAPLAMELITQSAIAVCPGAERVLDIGCGAGNNTLKLLQSLSPIDCDLVDLSRPMLEKAKERIEKVNTGKVRIFQSDFREVELEKSRYQIVFAAAVLHHLRDEEDWRIVFKKIFDLTAKGGSVWITDLVSHDCPGVQDLMWQRYGNYLESLGGAEYRRKVFDYIKKEDSPRSVSFQMKLLEETGFSSVDILHKNSSFAAFGAVK
jgi:tRNA (cmo5U34)-methyltransferase